MIYSYYIIGVFMKKVVKKEFDINKCFAVVCASYQDRKRYDTLLHDP